MRFCESFSFCLSSTGALDAERSRESRDCTFCGEKYPVLEVPSGIRKCPMFSSRFRCKIVSQKSIFKRDYNFTFLSPFLFQWILFYYHVGRLKLNRLELTIQIYRDTKSYIEVKTVGARSRNRS